MPNYYKIHISLQFYHTYEFLILVFLKVTKTKAELNFNRSGKYI